jgi:hypothetical protein
MVVVRLYQYLHLPRMAAAAAAASAAAAEEHETEVVVDDVEELGYSNGRGAGELIFIVLPIRRLHLLLPVIAPAPAFVGL